METSEMKTNVLPRAERWVKSPLRNLLIIELDKPIAEVWDLVGDPGNMPKYSSGLERVETKKDSNGKCSQYTCYFKPMEAGSQGIVHTANMVWQEENRGWASLDAEPNEIGLTESLSLTTFEEQNGKTIVKWYMHYNMATPEMIEQGKAGLKQAFADIGSQLVGRFGGRIVVNFMEGKSPN